MDSSSIQTLIKILSLEQSKEYQNTAVIGGFGRFAHHWAREALSKAETAEDTTLIETMADKLRAYEQADVNERPNILGEIISLANSQLEAAEATPPPAPPRKIIEATPDDIGIGEPDEGEDDTDLFGFDEDFDGVLAEEAHIQPQSVRERRGYDLQPVPERSADLSALEQPVASLKGVGAKRAEQLASLGVATVRDLLYLFPRRYDDYSRLCTIRQLKDSDTATVIGIAERIKGHKLLRGGTRVEAYLKDDTGHLRINWFNQPWVERQLNAGDMYAVSGKVEAFQGRLVMNNPDFEALDEDSLHTGRVVPVYPLTKGLGAKTLRNLVHSVVDQYALQLPDILPLDLRQNADLMDYGDAVQQAHFPDSWMDKEAALYRLAYDEVLAQQLLMLRRRHEWQEAGGIGMPVADEFVDAVLSSLPFELTGAQQRALGEIRTDMASERPMNRLLQGDVGSGKTIVGATAIAIAATNGVQSALMAPTSILAEQHFNKISKLLADGPLGDQISVALLTGNVSAEERTYAYEGLANGTVQVVVGTHALIQEGVTFANLGLAIIDEQHRFGTGQRGILRDKANGHSPDLLVMTATPIPRTLALTLHADLDLTLIDEMPPGRQPIKTRVLQKKERERAYGFVRGQIEAGRQAYIICPLVEDSDSIDAKSATSEYERLQNTIYPDLRLGLLHGRMSPSDKDTVMEAFYANELDILVSTTVIEVGIDVPNASVMMVENANRFGLAQLHQLRGRVGRGEHAGYCLLVSDKSFLDGDPRLSILEETTDGFVLAEKDLEIRGPGDLLGTRQSGYQLSANSLAFFGNSRFIEQVKQEAYYLFEEDPYLNPYPELAAYVEGRNRAWGDVS